MSSRSNNNSLPLHVKRASGVNIFSACKKCKGDRLFLTQWRHLGLLERHLALQGKRLVITKPGKVHLKPCWQQSLKNYLVRPINWIPKQLTLYVTRMLSFLQSICACRIFRSNKSQLSRGSFWKFIHYDKIMLWFIYIITLFHSLN